MFFFIERLVFSFSFCPTDNKFATCSDDGLVKVWDFYKCQEERTLRGKVNCVAHFTVHSEIVIIFKIEPVLSFFVDQVKQVFLMLT